MNNKAIYTESYLKKAVMHGKDHWDLEVHDTDAAILWMAEQYLKSLPILEFYANPKTYDYVKTSPSCSPIKYDKGQRARDLLEAKP